MLGSTDIKILSTLQNHRQRHLADIGKEGELSPPAVSERVKKLEPHASIKANQALFDAKKAAKDITAFVGVSTSRQCYIDNFATHRVRHETRSTIIEIMEP